MSFDIIICVSQFRASLLPSHPPTSKSSLSLSLSIPLFLFSHLYSTINLRLLLLQLWPEEDRKNDRSILGGKILPLDDMVKLATARESRFYGTRASRNRWEYVNAGLYVLGSILLMGGFAAQFSSGDAKSGLAVLGIGLLFVTLVNVHDLLAHMAGIDYRFALIGSDPQLALVELAVPSVQALGSILNLMGILIFLFQAEKGYNLKLERSALYLLIVGPVLWVIGSIHNSCQIYERANGHVQILQKSVQIPFLMGSLLFLVGGIVNSHGHFGLTQHSLKLLRKSWVWMALYGSMLFFIGGLMNLVKVFKMQQMDGVRLEKLRGGAQEQLSRDRDREGQVPLISEDQRRRKAFEEPPSRSFPVPTPYKDALLSGKS